MIHFYQKAILRNAKPSTWLNEMCSMMAEDFLAIKMKVDGPRGVAYNSAGAGEAGNYTPHLSYYNAYNSNTVKIEDWGTDFVDYSMVYAFGAYLARNYGGASLFKNIVQSSQDNYSSIDYALEKLGYKDESFSTILRKWGAANLVSDSKNMSTGYKYNSDKWFTSSTGGVEFKLGAINLFNYGDGPLTFTTLNSAVRPPASNIYYVAGEKLTGSYSWKINIDSRIKMSVVIK